MTIKLLPRTTIKENAVDKAALIHAVIVPIDNLHLNSRKKSNNISIISLHSINKTFRHYTLK